GKEQKVILVVGATGAGKSTLINRMVNYILGVKWEDKHRFKIIAKETNKTPAKSQTSAITAYELGYREGFRVPYNLTIIDTPGFGDTRGIERDNRIIEQIRTFFTAPGSINSIDAVCFVIQASQCCFTPTERYVFDSILSISGKDIAENILVLVTFADGKKVPVLATIEVSDVSCSPDSKGIPVPFKFNNAALFANNEAENSNADFRQMWDVGEHSMRRFFLALNKLKTKPLLLTKEVLTERKQREETAERLQVKVNVGLVKEELRKTKQSLEDNKAKMDANKDEYEVEVKEGRRGKLGLCPKCVFTCHDGGSYVNEDKKYCCTVASGKDGYCTVCPEKCFWEIHCNQHLEQIYEELKNSFEEATGEILTTNKVFDKFQEDYSNIGLIVTKLINQLSESLACLDEIILRPPPPEYIAPLIQSEEQEVKPGYMENQIIQGSERMSYSAL
uniref:AAA+ ATPase domain-containing protein n=1 Tax=Latimeria chalumnae TaxID=7897 RepID=H2ZYH2_LATCH